ncbi:MAG: medium chain dehydrogenase/reductase family protein [Actinomycetota bacterium]
MTYRRVRIDTFGGPEVLRVVEEPTLPEPGPSEVRVRVLAASVSFTDTMIRQGSYPDLKDDPPITPGYDVVGVIDKLGPGASKLAIGQNVADLLMIGGYSEYLCLPEHGLVPVPDTVDPAEAASLILSYVTAYQLLHRKAEVQSGQRVLIHGGGGAVGSALIQLGSLVDLEMYATGSAAKQDHIADLGATPIDYTRDDFVERIAELTGDGVDAVFDGVSLANANRSYRTLRTRGTLAIYGASNVDIGSGRGKAQSALGAARLALRWVTTPRRHITGYSIRSLRTKYPDWFHQDLTALFELVAEGRIRPVIDTRIDLDEIRSAHELIERASPRGRIVITMEQQHDDPS